MGKIKDALKTHRNYKPRNTCEEIGRELLSFMGFLTQLDSTTKIGSKVLFAVFIKKVITFAATTLESLKLKMIERRLGPITKNIAGKNEGGFEREKLMTANKTLISIKFLLTGNRYRAV